MMFFTILKKGLPEHRQDDTLLCHFLFIPRLQEDLDLFWDGWDNHPLRTEGNMTPNQLWELVCKDFPVERPVNAEGSDIF